VDGVRETVRVGAGETRSVTIRLVAGRIEGIVVDSVGRPVSGATLELTRRSRENLAGIEIHNIVPVQEVETDEHGGFDLADVAPGRYRISAATDRQRGWSELFDLDGGEQLRGLRISIEPLVSVRVEVRDSAGKPVAGAEVELYLDGEDEGYGDTNREGFIALRVLPGSYRLQASRSGKVDITVQSVEVGRTGSQVIRVELE
jgi:hypothetical protein